MIVLLTRESYGDFVNSRGTASKTAYLEYFIMKSQLCCIFFCILMVFQYAKTEERVVVKTDEKEDKRLTETNLKVDDEVITDYSLKEAHRFLREKSEFNTEKVEKGNKMRMRDGSGPRHKIMDGDVHFWRHGHRHHPQTKKDPWMEGFVHSFIMILSMEFMDKTFFISAIMAMTHNKWIILIGSVSALFLMNGISCVMGIVLPVIMSRTVTITVASALFVFFGVKMIYDGLSMSSDEHSEFAEAQEEVDAKMKPDDHVMESSPLLSPMSERKLCKPRNSVLVQIFVMIFFAEWGDRSQVSTILLAGSHPVLSVFLGGCFGYFCTSMMAVLGGSFLASKVSPRVITIAGGILFILFAIQTIFMK